MKILYILTLLAILFVSPLVEAIECPDGYKCLTDEQALEVAEALDNHNCMVDEVLSGELQMTMEPNQIVISHDGQVFVNDTITANLEWCDWHLELIAPASVLVHHQEPDIQTWGFRLRVRLGAGLVLTRFGTDERLVAPFLLFEPFFLYDFTAQIFFGIEHFGPALGLDLTRNLNIFGGLGVGYTDAALVPILGLSLSFN